ncbi:MAG: adenylate/guanylate cyclase domain-containing protein [Gemmatimonadetes bacterium]|nr:adenylate/guanylate cyclase domain-containing protein [Gemmatimonadota bacterium]
MKLDATIAYADLADSTELAMDYDARVAAKVFRAFLAMSTRILRHEGGSIRSFDGDRVMGIFVGNYKNTSAVKAALKINWAFLNLLKPKLLAKYSSLANGSYKLVHCTGVDTSSVLAVRAGIRGNNDLVWVGRCPNVAAKLSAIRSSPYHSYISGEVYDQLAKEGKESPDGRSMWEERSWTAFPRVKRVFRSNWAWTP